MTPDSLQSWRQCARDLKPDSRPVIDGRRRNDAANRTFQSINPADASVFAEVPDCGPSEIDASVASARRAFEAYGSWGKFRVRERAAAILKLADLIEREAKTLALLDSLEMGMPISQALADIPIIANQVRFCAESADKLIDEAVPGAVSGLTFAIREPQGVVAAITPWNFPLYTAMLKIAPALAVGNSIVLKPSEVASLSALRVADLALEAGIPPGVLNVVTGRGAGAGAALAQHRDVDYLTFTGSTATGAQLMALAGSSNLKQLGLECGGKAPQIVLADMLQEPTLAAAIAAAVFWNAGQVCTSGSRLIIPQEHAEQLVAAVAVAAEIYKPGDPLDPQTVMGPLGSFGHRERVENYLELAKQQGAFLYCGGTRESDFASGAYLSPAIFTRVARTMRIAREEIFGPVLSVLTYRTVEEAIEIANDSDYGLSASVRTLDVDAAMMIARRLQAGIINISGRGLSPAPDAVALAAEPRKYSGFGVEGGLAGLRAYTRSKLITLTF